VCNQVERKRRKNAITGSIGGGSISCNINGNMIDSAATDAAFQKAITPKKKHFQVNGISLVDNDWS